QTLCQETGLTFPPLVGKERYAWVVNHLFIGVAACRMVPDVVKSARDWAADLILRESLEFSGCVAAEFLDRRSYWSTRNTCGPFPARRPMLRTPNGWLTFCGMGCCVPASFHQRRYAPSES